MQGIGLQTKNACPKKIKIQKISVRPISHLNPAACKSISVVAGLLTRPVHCAFPAKASGKSAMNFLFREGLTAASTVPDSHRIPV